MKSYLLSILWSMAVLHATAQGIGDYRSNHPWWSFNLNWNEPSNWERYNGTDWVETWAPPTAFNAGIITIRTGDRIVNTDTLYVSRLVVDGLLLQRGYMIVTQGSSPVGQSSSVTVNGAIYFEGTTRVRADADLTINGYESKFTGGSLINNGTVNWNANFLSFQDDPDSTAVSSVTNNGWFFASGNNELYRDWNGKATFYNNGQFIRTGPGATTCGMRFINGGSMYLTAGSFLSKASFNNAGTLDFQDGATFENSGDASFNTGTVITGEGNIIQQDDSLRILPNLVLPPGISLTFNAGDITFWNKLTVEGNFIWNKGRLRGSGPGSLTIANNLQWNGGQLICPAIIQQRATVNVEAPDSYDVILSSQLTNNGTINWNSGYFSFDGGRLINNQTFNDIANNELYNYSTGTFTNSRTGVFTKLTGTGYTVNGIDFTNSGTLQLRSGTFLNFKKITNTGLLNFDGGAILENRADLYLKNGTSVTGTGSIFQEYDTIRIIPTLTLPGGILFTLNNGTVEGGGTLRLNDTMNWNGGILGLDCIVTNSGTVNLNGYEQTLYQNRLTNNGTINWNSAFFSFHNAVFTNNKTFNITADNNVMYNYGNGTIENGSSGVVSKLLSGTTFVSVPFTNAGKIKGAGILDFGTNLTNIGTFAPGSSLGIMTTGPNYVNKTLEIEMLNGNGPGTGHDQLVVNGNVQLQDTLRIFRTGTVPAGIYTILSYTGTLSGNFTRVIAPKGFTVLYVPRNKCVNVRVVNAPALQELSQSSEDQISSITPEALSSDKLVVPNFVHRAQPWRILGLQGLNTSITILDVQGNIVLKLNNYQYSADLSRLTPGAYIYQLLCKDADHKSKVYTGKLVVAD